MTIGLVLLSTIGIALYPKYGFSGNDDFQYSVNFNICRTENPQRLSIQVTREIGVQGRIEPGMYVLLAPDC